MGILILITITKYFKIPTKGILKNRVLAVIRIIYQVDGRIGSEKFRYNEVKVKLL